MLFHSFTEWIECTDYKVKEHFDYFNKLDIICCSHLMGMFYRTIRMVENGIKPVYVFDGKPPDMKSGEVRTLLLI